MLNPINMAVIPGEHGGDSWGATFVILKVKSVL